MDMLFTVHSFARRLYFGQIVRTHSTHIHNVNCFLFSFFLIFLLKVKMYVYDAALSSSRIHLFWCNSICLVTHRFAHRKRSSRKRWKWLRYGIATTLYALHLSWLDNVMLTIAILIINNAPNVLCTTIKCIVMVSHRFCIALWFFFLCRSVF